MGNTVLSQPEDSGMIRIDEKSNLGVAISTDANARWSYLNPYEGAKWALAESCRNIAVTGAKPLAVTNCLNFGSPEDPGVMWQFAESVRGLADACLDLGLPVTGGNVSFYNQTGSVAILPTPIIGTLGVISDVTKRTSMGIREDSLDIYLVGKSDGNFSGSEWAHLHGEIGNSVPHFDATAHKKLISFLLAAQPLLHAAHDISNGGLAATITEMVLRYRTGATLKFQNAGEELFVETPGRALLVAEKGAALDELASQYSVPITKIGRSGGEQLKINETTISLDELHQAFTETFAKLFG